jgi:hypothetical protein
MDGSLLNAASRSPIPLFRVGSAGMLPTASDIRFVDGTKPGGWTLRATSDGLGYNLCRTGLVLIVK